MRPRDVDSGKFRRTRCSLEVSFICKRKREHALLQMVTSSINNKLKVTKCNYLLSVAMNELFRFWKNAQEKNEYPKKTTQKCPRCGINMLISLSHCVLKNCSLFFASLFPLLVTQNALIALSINKEIIWCETNYLTTLKIYDEKIRHKSNFVSCIRKKQFEHGLFILQNMEDKRVSRNYNVYTMHKY